MFNMVSHSQSNVASPHVFLKKYTVSNQSLTDHTTHTVALNCVKKEPNAYRLYQWMNKPHVAEFWHQAWSKEKIAGYLANKIASYHQVYWVYMNDEPIGYAEIYPVSKDRISAFCDDKTAYGWHFLIGPKHYIGSGYPFLAAHALLSFIFEKIQPTRIYCEPDQHNTRMIKFIEKLGHQFCKNIILIEKKAHLMFVDRDDFNKIDGSQVAIHNVTPQKNRVANA